MPQSRASLRGFPWRSAGALFFLFAALIGFESGVGVSERPEILEAGLLTKAYYSLSLFVVGGVDLGTPYGGPWLGRVFVWTAYFGAPILAASTLIQALLKALAPQSWKFRRLKDHVIVSGHGELCLSYLRALREHSPKVSIVVVCPLGLTSVSGELEEEFGAIIAHGDLTHAYFLKQLRVHRARKVVLLDDNSMRSYEAASILIRLVPEIGSRVVIHCGNLRFMRSMQNTRVAKNCESFNTYHLAAVGLVRSHMLHHFRDTQSKDVVVIAGFGRFGQTILEELQRSAIEELDTVIIIDIDAHRRVLVADKQMNFSGQYQRKLYEGDISHPEVWARVQSESKLDGDNAVFVLGTGQEEENLRTALWLRRQSPLSMVIARSSKESQFAAEVGQENDIVSISINQLVEQNIPRSWLESN